MDFSLTHEIVEHPGIGKVAILNFGGPIDRAGLVILDNTVQNLYRDNIYYLIFNLAQTTSINSSAIGLIINITQQVEAGGGAIRLIQVAERFNILFELLSLQDKLPILPNKEMAMASFSEAKTRKELPTLKLNLKHE